MGPENRSRYMWLILCNSMVSIQQLHVHVFFSTRQVRSLPKTLYYVFQTKGFTLAPAHNWILAQPQSSKVTAHPFTFASSLSLIIYYAQHLAIGVGTNNSSLESNKHFCRDMIPPIIYPPSIVTFLLIQLTTYSCRVILRYYRPICNPKSTRGNILSSSQFANGRYICSTNQLCLSHGPIVLHMGWQLLYNLILQCGAEDWPRDYSNTVQLMFSISFLALILHVVIAIKKHVPRIYICIRYIAIYYLCLISVKNSTL